MDYEIDKNKFITWRTTAIILFFVLLGVLATWDSQTHPATGPSTDTGAWDYPGGK